ncbi:hypothetical protein BV22DRAFT_1133426 [Leucogyrophana mollusca]|uniref:Uncharacterized protein n=1 Tax=Leucogyrophana mollusca TaxID=85980 RepID=A0ACB8B2L9_9AGAM|nr:hypothetical protein BV22DRAFT_1133426 [Leucogyrophana mollusca]
MATIESAVLSMYYNNCFSVVVTTLLVYDYFLTIGQEVEYIWRGPISLMSLLYYVVRYIGLFLGIIFALWGDFIAGSVPNQGWEMCSLPPGAGFYIFVDVAFYVIVWMSAAIMVLRVFAMYNQSKIILGVLLLFFVPTVVATIVLIVKFLNISSAKSDVIVFDLLGTSYCAQLSSRSLLAIYLTIPRICFDVLLVVLAVGRNVKDAMDSRVLGKWQPNVYLQILARDSIMYFLLHLVLTIIERTLPPTMFPTWYQYIGIAISDTVPFMLAPHLIISFRYHTKADAVHSGFASQLGTSLGAGNVFCEAEYDE